ncbi:btk-binding protein-related [Anaeramoeba flamelloides]|uniref:Btk-binding protein-related n=1 Tax=Anaeramoeba flamelloides TaxID=1746091 RepID=A0AAV7Y6C7_9EUKA|nr:btk-binding protein-related [Anaeramoeba flamelloides]
MSKSKIYLSGSISFKECCSESKLPVWSEVDKIEEPELVKKVVMTFHCFLVWKTTGLLQLYLHSENKFFKYKLPNNETIKDIQSGYQSFLVLTECGKVYSIAQLNTYKEIPLSDPNLSKWDLIRHVSFFEENNLFVESITMGAGTNYYVCKGNKLYTNGYNFYGQLLNGTQTESQTPIYVCDKVDQVFSGVHSIHCFLTKTSGELFACGCNDYGQLGAGDMCPHNNLDEIKNWKSSDITDIYCTFTASLLLSKEGKLYSCGGSLLTSTGKLSKVFTHVPTLQDHTFTKIQGGENFFIAQTSDYKLYGWGFTPDLIPNEGLSVSRSAQPSKITPPTYFAENLINFTISSGTKGIFIYSESQNSLIDDFKKLFESKKYCDSKIKLSNKDEIPCHKLILELRTNLKFEQIQNIFNQKNFTCEEINCFLQYIYYDYQSNREFIKKIFKSLNLNYPHENNLVSDLYKLYKNEESKDFNILVYEDYDDDDENFEEIPVHKLILLTRSGLFREMFENINEKEQNTNQIKDYSGKTIESLELLIKYFYTNSINLTADDDPELVVEELGDATEYYQLSEMSNLKLELDKIKSQFKI